MSNLNTSNNAGTKEKRVVLDEETFHNVKVGDMLEYQYPSTAIYNPSLHPNWVVAPNILGIVVKVERKKLALRWSLRTEGERAFDKNYEFRVLTFKSTYPTLNTYFLHEADFCPKDKLLYLGVVGWFLL